MKSIHFSNIMETQNIKLTIKHNNEDVVLSGKGNIRKVELGMSSVSLLKENGFNPSNKMIVCVDVLDKSPEEAASYQKRMFSIHDEVELDLENAVYKGEYYTWSRINGQPLLVLERKD